MTTRAAPSLKSLWIAGAQAWLHWAARRFAQRPSSAAVVVGIALLVAFTTVAACGALSLARAPSVGLSQGWDFVLAILLPPAAYLGGWQLLSFASLGRSLRGAAVAAGMCAAGFGATFLAGLATVGLAVPVAALASVSVIGAWLARQDAAEAGSCGGAGRFAHTAGLVLFLLGLIPAAMQVAAPDVRGVGVALLAAAALPHGMLTLLLRGTGLHVARQFRRGLGLLAIAWVVPVPFLGWAWLFVP